MLNGSPASHQVKRFPTSGSETSGAYERKFVPHLGDALRLVALLAVPAAWMISGKLSALTMLLVCGGTWALRFYSPTRSADILGQLVLLLGGIFSVLGTYKIIGWLDLAVHFAMLMILTKMLANMLLHHRAMPAVSSPRQAGGVLLSVTSMGVLLAVLWEIGEWVGHTFISTEVGVGYTDTLGDLMAGFLGALVAALWFHRSTQQSRQS